MARFRFVVTLLLVALVLSACGGSPAAAPDASSAAGASTAAGAAAPAADASQVADLVTTAQALANDPTALAELQATVLAQKPTSDGCDPATQNVNADRSSLQATWTADNQINLKGELDAPEDATFFVFVFNNGAPIYWANFPEIKPSGKSWDFTTTSPAADDAIMGDLSKENPYTPDSKICVSVTVLKPGLDLSELTDPAKAQEALLAQLRLPVGGTAPAAIALPTANPAGGEGICGEDGTVPIAKFKEMAPLLEGAYADALKGAQAWQADARLYEVSVGCAILSGLRWEFAWLSDSAKKLTVNTAREPEAAPEDSLGRTYETDGTRETVDLAAVPITLDKLGDALVAGGYTAEQSLGVLSQIKLGHATKENFAFQTPEGGAAGLYYQLSIQVKPDDLGERVMVSATDGKVYKP